MSPKQTCTATEVWLVKGKIRFGQIEQQIDIPKTNPIKISERNEYKQDEVLVDWGTKRNNKIMKSEDLKVSHSD